MKNMLILILLFFNSPIFSQSSNKDDSCRKKLEELSGKEMFGDHDGYALIKGIEKLLKKCPKSALIHWAYAENLQEKGAFFNMPDWQKTSFIHYAKAFELEPTDADYRWGYANTLEYIGQYYKASQQYEWLVENDTFYRRDAKAHMITCNFLDKYGGGNKSVWYSNKIQPTDEELSGNEYFKKRTSEKLSQMTAATSIAGNIRSGDAEYNQVQVTLGLLSDWKNDPSKASIAEQNDLFVAILATLSIIILEKALNTKVGNFDFSLIKNELSGFADKSISEEYREIFKELKPQEGRVFEIGNDLTITEKWSVANFSGNYECISSSSNSKDVIGLQSESSYSDGGGCKYTIKSVRTPMSVISNGSRLEISFKEKRTTTAKGPISTCNWNAVATITSFAEGRQIDINKYLLNWTTKTNSESNAPILGGKTSSSGKHENTLEYMPDGTLKFSYKEGWSIYKKTN
jgi:tetratricopeptide (TPR) repeat protein